MRRGTILAALCVLAALIRDAVAYHGGIWADEGFFLLLVRAPSWRTMLRFLHFHESHPPFFYAVMRVWMALTGGGDAMALLLCVAIGTAIVPAVFIVGEKLFSPRAALIAAGFAAVSPPLIEHSAQLRPYGLMPLLALISCFALVTGIRTGGARRWGAYSLSTVLLLYTHNWSWLVVIGQLAAIVSILVSGREADRRRVMREWILSWLAIGIVYLPWIPALLFQVGHAGHGPIVIDTVGHWVELTLLAVPAAVMMIVAGHVADVSLTLWLVIVAVGAATVFALGTSSLFARAVNRRSVAEVRESHDGIAMLVFTTVPVVSVVLAVVLSSRSNLLLPRCMATLTPIVLLVISGWLSNAWSATRSRPALSPLGAGAFTVIASMSVLGTAHLIRTERSNSRETAGILSSNIRPGDLLVVAPEWYAASLNHYFTAPVQQIDYPYPGKSGMIDFSHVFERVSDPAPLSRLRDTISVAARDGRRVWLVTARDYVRPLRDRDVIDATQFHLASAFSIIRVHQIEDALTTAFGPADLRYLPRGPGPLNDDLLVFLYTRAGNSPQPATSP